MVATRSSTRKSSGMTPEASTATATATATSTATVSPVNSRSNERNGAATNGNGADHDAKRRKVAQPVDKTRWRLKSDDGCHTWHYLDDDKAAKEWPQSYADKWYLDLPLVRASLLLDYGRPLYFPILTSTTHRTSLLSPPRKPPSTPPAMASPSSNTCNSPRVTGAANTAGPCSFSRATS